MSLNLVEGGARRGWFQTRHSRMVHIIEPFDFAEAPQPGKQPEIRTCWRGQIFQADGKTLDTNGIWEQSGATQNAQGVIQRTDLVILVSLDPEPEAPPVVAQIAAPDEIATLKTDLAQADATATEYELILDQIGDVFDEEMPFSDLPAAVRTAVEKAAKHDELQKEQPAAAV